MVLPTLPSYLELKKVNFNQDLIRNKHRNEFDNLEKWSNTTKYFNSSNNLAHQHTQWTSEKSFNNSMNAFSKKNEESLESRQEKIKNRQQRLKLLLQNENSNYEKELREIRSARDGKINSNEQMDFFKQRIENIKSSREQDRKKLAEEKLYQHWRENNPELRQIDSKNLEKYVTNQWNDQIKEKEAAVKLLEAEENEYAKYLELEKQKAEDLDLELKRLKLNREVELKEILKQQMIELKQKEAESEIIHREEAELMQEQYEVLQLNERRDIINEAIARQEYGRSLLRQHKAKLRQKAKEIQESLELDLKILQMIADTQDKQKHLESQKRQNAKAEAEHMIQILNQQLRLEKEREIELDAMFQDEAVKEWEKRNLQWEKERLARENLMKQVLSERKLQMEQKLNFLQQKKFETLQQREELIKDMEKTQALAIREKEKLEKQKLIKKQDLESQITTRKETVFKENILKNVDNYEQEQIKENEMKIFLDLEKQKQQNQPKFEPKSFGRKKVAWT